ncbi:MAG: 5-methyltetrahydropteroyltriglutamate--homocysteine methyltransferase [Elusimicrobia bacterium]|nr:5-methyltetrahydropteroyltriglutamate--homocysteine methyltransferase [Elusimicrobiota bacterium]
MKMPAVLSLPLLPTSAAGDLPKQIELTELRHRVANGINQATDLERKEKLSTELWLRYQEKIGLDILVDGEMNRGDMIQYFSSRILGFQEGELVRCYGNRYYRRPVIKHKLESKGPLVSEMWKYAQRLTNKPVKAVLTGPFTLMDWSFNEYYTSRESLCRDLTKILRTDLLRLIDSGAQIIQIDELAISGNPKNFSLAKEALKELLRGIKAYVILRFGYGDLSTVWPKMKNLPVDNIHVPFANSRFIELPLLKKFPTNKDITIGFLDSHNRAIETPREMDAHIKAVLKIVPLKRLWLSSDAGLKTRSVDEALAKLTALTQSAAKHRPH